MDDVATMLPTPAEPPNGEYSLVQWPSGMHQLCCYYPNGYGASVVGGLIFGLPFIPHGVYELAVLHEEPGRDRSARGDQHVMCHHNPVTSGIARGNAEEIVELLHLIAHLERDDQCDHGRNHG